MSLQNAFLGSLVADAVSMPVHWYYNREALDKDYGDFHGYCKPHKNHPDSILWRSQFSPINHKADILGKQAKYWGQKGIHYHQFLDAGDNTLNLQLAAELYRDTIINGSFEKEKWLKSLVTDIEKLRRKGKEFVIVSSGAIALGQNHLRVKKKRLKIEMSQALASVGQIYLTNIYKEIFKKKKINIGQILISPDDTEQRRRAINIKRTFENLFKLKAIPVVNENDTTATSEIKYGYNDRLAARVAQ